MLESKYTATQVDVEAKARPGPSMPKETWFSNDRLNISFNPYDCSILVTEQAPLPCRIAFCGGGPKIPGHIGAYDELLARKLDFSEYSGSSAGAMIAAFAYLGYDAGEINKIISWFDDDKLLDAPFSLNFYTIRQIISKGGLSSAKSLHQAANYVILKKVMAILTDDQYKQRFAKHQDFLKKNVFDCPGCITFATLAKIKEICPECEIGEYLSATGTNLSTQACEIFSVETTPDMGVADAVTISANFPLAFERINLNGKIYSDGGIVINYPVRCFSSKQRANVFLKHKHDVDYSVVGVQFDQGYEVDALYSEKPLHQWSWLSSYALSWVTGHQKVTDNWHNDLSELRKHAHQSILIKTPNIPFGKFALDEAAHTTLVNAGRTAASDYLDQHGYYIDASGNSQRNEWMYEKFDTPEELVNYCFEQKQFTILRQIKQAISASQYLEKGYKQYLGELCDHILSSSDALDTMDNDAVNDKGKSVEDRGDESRTLTFFSPLSEASDTNKSILNIQLYTNLYPILVQNWQQLCPVSGISDILNVLRLSLLTVDTIQNCIENIWVKLQTIDSGHFLVFLFKYALKHHEAGDFDGLLEQFNALYYAIELSQKNQIHTDDVYYGHWDFHECDIKNILQLLRQDDRAALANLLATREVSLNPA